MRSKLKELKYSEDLDVNSLAEGQPTAYLPIYHYAFTNYSQPIAQLIFDKGIELFGKSDARFMEAVYKILRDIFAYKPPITKEQFFAKGFAERKVIMCTEILQLIKKKQTELNPAPSKTTMKTSVRPKSAQETKNLPLAVPKTKRSEMMHPSRVSPQEPNRMGPRGTPQVVNELTALPSHEPVRHLSTSASHTHPVRHIAGNDSLDSLNMSDQSESMPQKPPSILSHHSAHLCAEAKPVRHVSIQSPRQTEQSPPNQGVPSAPWVFEDTPERQPVRTHFITPSIKKVCPKSVEVVCLPKGQYDEDKDEDTSTSIVEIQAPTSDSVLHGPVPTSSIDIDSLYQTVEMLGEQVQQLAQGHQVGVNSETSKKMEEALSKIENLTARIYLLENRVSIIESKMEEVQLNTYEAVRKPSRSTYSVTQTNKQPPPLQPIDTSILGHGDISVDSPGLFAGPGDSFAEELKALSGTQKSILKANSDFSLNYSPIRQVANGLTGKIVSANEDTFAMEAEDDARRASTPTMNGTLLGESSFKCDISHLETKDAVERIRNMIKETTQMIKENPSADIGS